jgi:hypothetical protein
MAFSKLIGRAERGTTTRSGSGATHPGEPGTCDVEAVRRLSRETSWARADTRLLTTIIAGLRGSDGS